MKNKKRTKKDLNLIDKIKKCDIILKTFLIKWNNY